jgi:hypothetical protein
LCRRALESTPFQLTAPQQILAGAADVQDVYTSADDGEQRTVGSSSASLEEQLADLNVVVGGLWGQCTFERSGAQLVKR